MTILTTKDKMNKMNKMNTQSPLIMDRLDRNRELYFVNLDNYLQIQNNQLFNYHQQRNQKSQIQNHQQTYKHQNKNQLINEQKDDKFNQIDNQVDREDEQNNFNQKLNKPQSPIDTYNQNQLNSHLNEEQLNSSTNQCFGCFDRLTDQIERSRLIRQPTFNLIKCFIVLLSIIQLCIFLLAVITYRNNEQTHFYSKPHTDYFILGTNLANLNALLSTIFYLYSIIGEIWPLLCLMTTLQAFYSIIELLALLTEPIKVQYIYIVFIMLTSLQTFSMLLFVVILRIKKLKELKFNSTYV